MKQIDGELETKDPVQFAWPSFRWIGGLAAILLLELLWFWASSGWQLDTKNVESGLRASAAMSLFAIAFFAVGSRWNVKYAMNMSVWAGIIGQTMVVTLLILSMWLVPVNNELRSFELALSASLGIFFFVTGTVGCIYRRKLSSLPLEPSTPQSEPPSS